MKSSVRIAVLLGLGMGLSVTGAVAGPYADDLSKCLVSSSTAKDKTDLIRFIFSASALHPDVSDIAVVSAEQRSEITHNVAKLFERLLTESCRSQYRDAVKYEGDQVLALSFGVLGQAAMRGLVEHPAVAKGFADFGAMVDGEKLKAARQDDAP